MGLSSSSAGIDDSYRGEPESCAAPHHYGEAFFDPITRDGFRSAEALVPIILELLHPSSVVDVGCGEGAWLRVFERSGIADILGLDGAYVSPDRLAISKDRFAAQDLSQAFALDREYAMALSLEVAEHIPKASACGFVASLCAAAPIIVFSAAIPKQGGTFHQNEQWPDYWAALFQKHGYDCFDILRPLIWDNAEIKPWYRQNSLVYVRRLTDSWREVHQIATPNMPRRLVHPELFHGLASTNERLQYRLDNPGVRKSAKQFARALCLRCGLRKVLS